jgi:hypothetical protein
MAWESRGGLGRYYTTTTRRASGRRVRTYYGNGVAGDLASSMHELHRLERQEQERRHREDCLRWKVLEDDLGRLDQGVRWLTSASLLLAGYHHHKGEWRRRRDDAEGDRDSRD